jgi:hypothetical protein
MGMGDSFRTWEPEIGASERFASSKECCTDAIELWAIGICDTKHNVHQNRQGIGTSDLADLFGEPGDGGQEIT